MQDIYFLNYNNYYNRQVKNDGDYLSAYEPYIIDSLLNTNFNPNDGITTTHITGSWDYNHAPDYLLVFEAGTNFSPSRWFVIESVRTRMGQYQLSLVRDIISENYNSVLNSPCYIEKGWVPNTDSAIFNSEGVLVNQIKKNETKLYDYTGMPWIVGYMASYKSEGTGTDETINDYSLNLEGSFNVNSTYGFDSITDVPFYDYINNIDIIDPSITPKDALYGSSATENFSFSFQTQNIDASGYLYYQPRWTISPNPTLNSGINSNSTASITTGYTLVGNVIYNDQVDFNKVLSEDGAKLSRLAVLAQQSDFKEGLDIYTPTELLSISNLNEKIIYLRDIEKFFKVQLRYNYTSNETFEIPTSNIASSIFSNLQNKTTYFSGNNTGNLTATVLVDKYSLEIIEVEAAGYNISIPTSRNHLTNAPYDMFAIPYGNFSFNTNNTTVNANSEIALAVANIISQRGGQFVYDIQLLPYCPIQNLEKINNVYTLNGLTAGTDYVVVNSGNNPKTLMFWATSSEFTFNIDYTIEVEDYKITNECDMWRICSPNYNGVFEFNAAKNGGVQFFSVDCTYKPINPYIHINPNFGRLYGSDYNDARGLICGGDFSLATITDSWVSFELQNKNYEKTFQRQIENMEVQHDVAKTQEKWGVAVGTVQGVTSGATSGAIIGGGLGAVLGGVVGGSVSLAGGMKDIELNQTLRDEAKSYATDLYNYNLDNIKALPNSLAKVSAFTFNNKIVPFLEYYSCTEEEKEAIRNKIKYNGMTIMRVGEIKDYLKEGEETYIKAKLIRWISDTNTSEDFHHINYIAAELNKGVFITK